MKRAVICAALVGALPLALVALTHDQMGMLQDAGGWEYLTITDANNGFETQHVCFDEKGRGPCTGKLVLRADGTFSQTVTGYGKSLNRHGTFTLEGDSLTFIDELANKDGPYTVNVDTKASTLEIATTQAGVTIKVRLMLEREFRKRQAESSKQK